MCKSLKQFIMRIYVFMIQ